MRVRKRKIMMPIEFGELKIFSIPAKYSSSPMNNSEIVKVKPLRNKKTFVAQTVDLCL